MSVLSGFNLKKMQGLSPRAKNTVHINDVSVLSECPQIKRGWTVIISMLSRNTSKTVVNGRLITKLCMLNLAFDLFDHLCVMTTARAKQFVSP